MFVVVPGTWWRSKPAWAATYHLDSKPIRSASALFGSARVFEWSGENTTRARLAAAHELARQLHGQTSVTLLGFSHGGNIAAAAAAQLPRGSVQTLVTISTPVLTSRYRPVPGLRHIHLYSDRDLLQRGGGEWLHLPRFGSVGLAKCRYPEDSGVRNIHVEGLATTGVTGRHGDILWWDETWLRLEEELRLRPGNIPE